MTHPLTDEIIDEIIGEDSLFDDDMRAAADWQLEQVIQFLEINKEHSVETALRFIRLAMRPQVVDLPQANSDVCGEEGMKRAQQRTFEENDELMRLLADS